jgi:hypothetical protein
MGVDVLVGAAVGGMGVSVGGTGVGLAASVGGTVTCSTTVVAAGAGSAGADEGRLQSVNRKTKTREMLRKFFMFFI